mmetsp:Transcript_28423/g.51348  ORF Transcript_28423/g.51348 Transcript_28423/m.51348 type:complete len:456 (-) Transcript_28423:44-1411(-)
MPSKRVEVLLTWLREHGVNLQEIGVEVRESEHHGLGVFATRALRAGETVAQIPSAATLHAGKAKASQFGQAVLSALQQCEVSIEPEELLWLYMIWGRQEPKACPWYAYLQVLPDANPLSWQTDPEALAFLQGTPLAELAARELQEQKSRHAVIRQALAQKISSDVLGFEDWLWARACYLSRAFDRAAFPNEYLEPGWESELMLPFLDICNHFHKAGTKWRFGNSFAALTLPETSIGYEEGDEVFNLYGRGLGNSKLLMRYGFALKGNPHDCVDELLFEIKDDVLAERVAVLRSSGAATLEVHQLSSCVRLRLLEGLRPRMPETPHEVLRIASLLCRGCDYNEAEADSVDKIAVSRAVAKAARGMLRRGCKQPSNLAMPRCRRGLALLRSLQKKLGSRKALQRRRPLPLAGPSRSAAIYARSWKSILRKVAACASCEAEMAQLAAQMDEQKQDSDD